MNPDRMRELRRRVDQRCVATHGDRYAALHDAQHHAEVERLRQITVATDEAMEAEGVELSVRERVIYRLLYDEPPAAYETPNWVEASRRIVDSDLEALRLMSTTKLHDRRGDRPHIS